MVVVVASLPMVSDVGGGGGGGPPPRTTGAYQPAEDASAAAGVGGGISHVNVTFGAGAGFLHGAEPDSPWAWTLSVVW